MKPLWRMLGWDRTPATSHEQESALREIVQALDRLEPARARYLAAFAYILSRVAEADQHVSAEETAVMEQLVRERGGLPPEQAILVVQLAKTQSLLFGGTENFLVTREFARLATRDEKLSLLNALFAVSSADLRIGTVEDNEIRRISRELGIEHADFISVRAAYRDRLGTLKRNDK